MNRKTAEPLPDEATETLLATLESVEPIVTMSHEDLVVIALRSAAAASAVGYVTLADEKPGAYEISELDGGSVPAAQVKVGPQPLLVLAGETIVGGKQNRVINVSLWLGARKTTQIPVSCLEHGRWNNGHVFAAGRPVDLDFRSKVSRQVGMHARSGLSGYHADQGQVWRDINEKEMLFARRSPTAALHDLYASEAANLDKVARAFPMPEDANGLAIGIGGRLVALDLFDSAATLRRQWSRLIGSAASARLDHAQRVASGWLPRPQHRYPDAGALGRMLERAKASAAGALIRPSVGEGWDIRLQTRKLHGSALVHDGRVVHLALFRDEPPPVRHEDEPEQAERVEHEGAPVRRRS